VTTTSGALLGLSLIGFAAGAVVSAFSWQVGFAMLLLSMAVGFCSRYHSSSVGFAGSLALIPALMISVYVYGSVDRESPVYDMNVPISVWIIFAVGCLFLILGLSVGAWKSRTAKFGEIDFSGTQIFFWIGVIGVVIAGINYATGGIPVLADDINSVRFSQAGGVFASVWLIVHPITQMSVMVSLLKWMHGQLDKRWAMLGAISAVSLLFSGARSLIVMSLIAFGVVYLEKRRPKLSWILIASAIGLALLGVVGRFRALQSGGGSQYQSYLSRRGTNNWFGSLDSSLQTGPRVMTTAIDYLGGEQLGGQILLGDFPRLGAGKSTPSDQIVTLLLGRDPAVVGGSPPTIFGGMFLDFGWAGVVVGALLTGLLLVVARRIMYRSFSLPACIWFGYFAAYIALSGYSFLSLKPAWFVVLFTCIGAAIAHKESNGTNSNGIEVPPRARRARTPLA
jgi:oligosaccharide repeat unit polymerase